MTRRAVEVVAIVLPCECAGRAISRPWVALPEVGYGVGKFWSVTVTVDSWVEFQV